METRLSQRKKNITYIRAVITLIITLLALYNIFMILESRQYILIYILVLIASNIFFSALPAEKYDGMKLLYVLFIMDIIFLALGAYWLAYLDFKFFMVMFLTIFIAALAQSAGKSIAVALVVNIIYIYMKVTAGGGIGAMIEENSILNIPFLFVVALYGSYLSEKANEEIEEKRKLESSADILRKEIYNKGAALEQIAVFSEKVYDAFRQGIIITDKDGLVKTFNKSCEYIFVTKKNKTINVSYRGLPFLGEVRKCIASLQADGRPAVDREITINISGTDKRLLVNTGFIRDSENNPMGILCTVEILIDKIKRSGY